jgi:hypothetical protein
MPLTLQSRARRMQVFHLTHDVCCCDRCGCEEVTTVVVAENRRTGERGRQQLRKKVPGSITFLALEQKKGLPAALLGIAEIKAAIDRGYLRVIEHTADAAAVPPRSAPLDSAAPSTSRASSAASQSGAPPAPPPTAAPPAPERAATTATSEPTPVAKASGKEP